jgi:hypothetical protein
MIAEEWIMLIGEICTWQLLGEKAAVLPYGNIL